MQPAAAVSRSVWRSVRVGLLGMLVAGWVLAIPVAAEECTQAGMNLQCSDLGLIAMPSQVDVRGDLVEVDATVQLNSAYQDHAARWLLFSVRGNSSDGESPLTVQLLRFGTSAGEVVTTRVDHPNAHQVDLWVDTLDAPVGTTITLSLRVGAAERGAYRLETLVMPFDRGYAPIQDANGRQASLFSFTLFGVNKETPAVSPEGGSGVIGHKVSAPGFIVAVALLGAVWVARRRFA